jgi:hypothetical protein
MPQAYQGLDTELTVSRNPSHLLASELTDRLDIQIYQHDASGKESLEIRSLYGIATVVAPRACFVSEDVSLISQDGTNRSSCRSSPV